MKPLDYHSSGVNYDVLDEFKRHCQRSAATTTGLLARHGVTEPAGIRGESAYLLETPDEYLAHVEEGLGTKNLVADALISLTGESHYHAIGVDTVASIVNDLIIAHDYQDVALLVTQAAAELLESAALLMQSQGEAAFDAMEKAEDLLDAVYDIINGELDDED